MSNMNVQNTSVRSAGAQETGAADLNDLMKKMQEAQAKGDMQGMQDIAKQMMGEASKSVGNDPKGQALLELANKAASGDAGALQELETKANAMLEEAHKGSDLGAEGSRFMGTAQKVDVQQLQESKPVENASRASGVSFDTLLSNKPASAISQSAVSEDASSGGVRGAKAQDAQSTTNAELAASGIESSSVKATKKAEAAEAAADAKLTPPNSASYYEAQLNNLNTLLVKEFPIPTETNTRNGESPLSSKLESTASDLQSSISDVSSIISDMSKDIQKEDKLIAALGAAIGKLDEIIAKLKMESEAMISMGGIKVAAGAIMLSIAIAKKVLGAGLMALGAALLSNPFTAAAGVAKVTFGAKLFSVGLLNTTVSLGLIAGGTALIIKGKEKQDEYKAKEKERDGLIDKKVQAGKRKEMLEKKVTDAKTKKTQMEQQKAQVEAAKTAAAANETAAAPALEKASDAFLEAGSALDQLKAATPNPPTTAQKEAITALTAMLADLDTKLNAMYAPIDKGAPLTQAATAAFDKAMTEFVGKINTEYAKLEAQGNIT